MLSFDDLHDEAVDCRLAFPNRRGQSLHIYLWDYVRKNDWGFRLINGLSDRDAESAAPDVWWWTGEWGCLGWLLAVVLFVPTVGVRNLLVMPLYDRRIKGVVMAFD